MNQLLSVPEMATGEYANGYRDAKRDCSQAVRLLIDKGDWRSADNSAFVLTRETYLEICHLFGAKPKPEQNG